MPYGDGILKINCYSLTDFHDFEECPFRFFVRHHLDKKYEIDEGNEASALGNLLDQSIKKFHKAKYYGCEVEDLVGVVRAAVREMKDTVEYAKLKGKPHFYASTLPFLTEEVINKAISVFQNYYIGRGKKINQAIDEVGFCEWTFPVEGDNFKLWGGPDALEMGEDGVAEVVDYKSRQGLDFNLGPRDDKNANGAQDYKSGKPWRDPNMIKQSIDMDLMPKIYTLLCTPKLLNRGHKKARFKVRFWQDPKEESFFEEFDLEAMNGAEFVFKQKIERILGTKNFRPCGKSFCGACKSEKKDEFLKELDKLGLTVMTGEEFLNI